MASKEMLLRAADAAEYAAADYRWRAEFDRDHQFASGFAYSSSAANEYEAQADKYSKLADELRAIAAEMEA